MSTRPTTPRARVGIFGGSFDPVHRGHLHAARSALEAFDLEQVLFVPAARPPHKPERALAPARDRVAMLEIALADEPRFRVEALELERPGPSYTIDTVRELEGRLAAQGPELYLILGSDSLAGLADWLEVEGLLRCVQPIVVRREGAEPGIDPARLGGLSVQARERLARGTLRLAPVEVSATELRAALAAGIDPGDALPRGVREYALSRGLYRRERADGSEGKAG